MTLNNVDFQKFYHKKHNLCHLNAVNFPQVMALYTANRQENLSILIHHEATQNNIGKLGEIQMKLLP